MAPYDSYETALSAKENPDWTTAHLGSRAHRDCAIVLKNGQLKTGFQKSGYYTAPRCVRPLLEARVKAVQAKAGFNAWFLDAYATGMLFDSYRSVLNMTQAQNAEGNIEASRWIGNALKVAVGSEDDNATTAQGILFAHGMQTPVLGWGDRQVQQTTFADGTRLVANFAGQAREGYAASSVTALIPGQSPAIYAVAAVEP